MATSTPLTKHNSTGNVDLRLLPLEDRTVLAKGKFTHDGIRLVIRYVIWLTQSTKEDLRMTCGPSVDEMLQIIASGWVLGMEQYTKPIYEKCIVIILDTMPSYEDLNACSEFARNMQPGYFVGRDLMEALSENLACRMVEGTVPGREAFDDWCQKAEFNPLWMTWNILFREAQAEFPNFMTGKLVVISLVKKEQQELTKVKYRLAEVEPELAKSELSKTEQDKSTKEWVAQSQVEVAKALKAANATIEQTEASKIKAKGDLTKLKDELAKVNLAHSQEAQLTEAKITEIEVENSKLKKALDAMKVDVTEAKSDVESELAQVKLKLDEAHIANAKHTDHAEAKLKETALQKPKKRN
ncbi:hypothetical protein GQ44DRAFT_777045 [Phaeosphaeriaceae sp. PMI808]|nr:hypothetical protein GQ44DRAFT_777045 [Phaeosphaeriaceae sp. PMI808]